MLNYVILTSYSSYHYLMWNFTHMWMHNSVPLTCESLFFCGFQDLSMDHEQVLLAPYCLVGFFLHQCIIHGLPHIKPACPFILYGNLVPHRCLAAWAIILFCWAFSNIVCVGFMRLFGAIYSPRSNCKNGPSLLHLRKGFKYIHSVPAPTAKGTSITFPPLPYTTMGSNTTCWEINILESFLE